MCVWKLLKRIAGKQRHLSKLYHRAAFSAQACACASSWKDLPSSASRKGQPEVFIFSRFGQETLGNRLIQLGLLHALYQAVPERQVYLLSMDTGFTRRGLTDIKAVLSCRSAFADFSRYIDEKVAVEGEGKICSLGPDDLLMIGGGPIMDDPMLAKWLLWFQWARRVGAHTMIGGCGLNALRQPKAISMAEALLALTDVALVRNRPSDNFQRVADCPLELALDPAFLCNRFLEPFRVPKKSLLAINGRAISYVCMPDRVVQPDEVARAIAAQILPLAKCAKVDAVMPFSTREEDDVPDSAISTSAAGLVAQGLGIVARPIPHNTLLGLVKSLSEAEFVVSTRMHGFITGLLLGCRSANLDYFLHGGKGNDLYLEWLGRPSSPSLFVPGSLSMDDCLLLSDLDRMKVLIDGLSNQYVDAIRRACSN